MKTVEEIYKEIAGSKEMQAELKKMSDEMIGEVLKKHDCNASVKEFTSFARSLAEGEIEDSDAAAVAGGQPIWGTDFS